jgi:hypothetical protein
MVMQDRRVVELPYSGLKMKSAIPPLTVIVVPLAQDEDAPVMLAPL